MGKIPVAHTLSGGGGIGWTKIVDKAWAGGITNNTAGVVDSVLETWILPEQYDILVVSFSANGEMTRYITSALTTASASITDIGGVASGALNNAHTSGSFDGRFRAIYFRCRDGGFFSAVPSSITYFSGRSIELKISAISGSMTASGTIAVYGGKFIF